MQYTAANDNHEQQYATFTTRLGQFMRGERAIPASMSDAEWQQYKRVCEGRRLCRTASLAARRVRSLSFFAGMHGPKRVAQHAV